MPIDLQSPTAPPGPIVILTPCAGWIVVERLDANHDLVRSHDGSERVVPVIRIPEDRLMPKPDEPIHDIESITFEIVFKSGRARRAVFIQPEKTLDLLRDDGSLGDFLRSLVKRGTD